MAVKSENYLTRIRNFKNRHNIIWKTYAILATVPAIIRAKRAFSKVKYKGGETKCKVVVFSVRTIPEASLTHFDAVFAHGFRKLGCDVKMLICGGLLDSCDADTVIEDQRKVCFVCNRFRPLVKYSTGLDYILFRQYISPSDIKDIEGLVGKLDFEACSNYEYLGVPVGQHARAAAIRFFLAGLLNSTDPQHLTVLRKKLINAMITAKIASNLYSEEKPDRIIMLHGVYATWGPFADFFSSKEVDVIIYAQMVTPFGSFMFSRHEREYELVAKNTWAAFKQVPLTNEEEVEIDAYLSARFKGVLGPRLIFDAHFKPTSDKESALAALSGKNYFRCYVLYTNLAWDACLEGQGSSAFKDIFAWLDTTIGYFRKHADYQLIIKPHPAELVWEKCTLAIADYVANKYPDLPENIYVLKPDTPLTAYDLVFPGTVCLVFNGTTGLELATQGIPILAGGNAHYVDAGVVRKIETVEEYLGLLDNPVELFEIARKNQKLAKKYAYFYFLRLGIRIPFYRGDVWGDIDWAAMKKINEILDNDGTVMHICKRIIGKEDIVLPLG